MKKIFIGSFLLTVFLYVTMTNQVWIAMESWQRALWVLFMLVGQFSLFIIPFMYLSGYKPRNLKEEVRELQVINDLQERRISSLRTWNATYRNYIITMYYD